MYIVSGYVYPKRSMEDKMCAFEYKTKFVTALKKHSTVAEHSTAQI